MIGADMPCRVNTRRTGRSDSQTCVNVDVPYKESAGRADVIGPVHVILTLIFLCGGMVI